MSVENELQQAKARIARQQAIIDDAFRALGVEPKPDLVVCVEQEHAAAVQANEEIEQGLRCIAAPVRDDSGELVAGLSMSAPAERYDADWAPVVRETADAISSAMGYAKPASTVPQRP